MKKVACSGGVDPLHFGHVRYILEAAKYGDVYFILNSDSWLLRKKGYCFMTWEQRAEIIGAIKGVKEVLMAKDNDGTVCNSIKEIRPHYFAKGGDRTRDNTPEQYLCAQLGIEVIWNCGGGKIASSQELVRNATQ